MIKTYDVIIEPDQFLLDPNIRDTVLLKVFFEAIKESNQLGLNGYKVVTFQLVNVGSHRPGFYRQFVIEFEEVSPELAKDVTPALSNRIGA